MPAGPAQLLALADDVQAVQVVVMDVSGNAEFEAEALDLARRLEQSFPGVGAVLVAESPERLGLAAMRAGVRDVIEPATSVEDLRWTLRRSREGSDGRPGTPASDQLYAGRVVTVASPKGGVGKTTISTNLAVALAAQSPQGTVLIDLDVQFGDVAAALDLDPTYTLADVLSGPAADDPIALKALLTQHLSGLSVLPGVRSPAEADHVTGKQITTLLDLLKREFRYVVIDTAPGLSDQTLAAIDHTTDLVLVSSLDVPGIRGLRKELQLLDELDLQPSTRHVVVNMVDKAGGLSIADVEATISRKVDVVISRSPKVVRSTNAGVPIVMGQPRDAVSRDLIGLASRFSPSLSRDGLFSGRHRGRFQR